MSIHFSSRDELRGYLTRKRRMYFSKEGSYPKCPICLRPIKGGGEIHESLITRGMLRDVDRADLILVPENSNLVHSECHPESGRGNKCDFHRCANDLVYHEMDRVIEWLDQIEPELPIIVPQVRRDYLNAIKEVFGYDLTPITRIKSPKTVSKIEEMNL